MLALLEHLNFKVPFATGERIIQDFFVSRFGCPDCPTGRMKVSPPVTGPVKEGTPKQMHVNLGLSQIHFEWCTGDGRDFAFPQRLEGFVTVKVDDMAKLKANLQGLPYVTDDPNKKIIVMDPFGITTWVCEEATEDYRKNLARFGQVRAGGVGNILGISQVDYNCQIGVSASICKFYEDSFGVKPVVTSAGHAIQTRLGQKISWNETLAGPPPTAYELNPALWGIHMCFYIDRFEENAERLKRLFWVNPDYKIPPINDNVATVPAALKSRQFRLKHVGERYVVEHEIRAIDHPLSPIKQLLQAKM
jgi:hypothetical protein